jgi:hypothetical protein
VNIKSKYNTEDDVGEFDYAFSFLHLDKFRKDYSNFGRIDLVREFHYLVHNIPFNMPIGVCIRNCLDIYYCLPS